MRIRIFSLLLLVHVFSFIKAEAGSSVLQFKPVSEEREDAEEVHNCPPYAVLPPVNLCCEKTPFFSSASFIYWQGKMAGLDFAAKSNSASSPTPIIQEAINSRVYTPDFKWEPGVKAVFGYTFNYDGWDTLGRWTYFHGKLTNAKRSFSAALSPLGLGISPLWYYPFFQNTNPFTESILYRHASNYWNLVMNTWDWEWGRNFSVNDWLSLRLHGGIKTGYLRQTYKVHYEDGTLLAVQINTQTPSTFQYLKSDFVATNRFWGIGPRLGVDSKWKLGWGVSLIADSSFSIIPSFFKVRSTANDLVIDVDEALTTGALPLTADVRENFLDFIPVFQTLLGFDWGICLGRCSPFYMGLTVGYEMQYWWDVNQSRRGITVAVPGYQYNSHGDWQVQGLTASFNFQY